jgi:hypothetical protein
VCALVVAIIIGRGAWMADTRRGPG